MSKFNFLFDIGAEFGDGKSDLLHSITVTHGDASVFDGIKVVGDAEGSSHFVLAAISLTDGAGFVVINGEVLGQIGIDRACLLAEFL